MRETYCTKTIILFSANSLGQTFVQGMERMAYLLADIQASVGMPKMVAGLAEMTQRASCDWGLASSVSVDPRCFFVCPLHMANLGFLMVDLVDSNPTWFLNSSDRAEDARSFKGSTPEPVQHPFQHVEGTSQGQARLKGTREAWWRT